MNVFEIISDALHYSFLLTRRAGSIAVKDHHMKAPSERYSSHLEHFSTFCTNTKSLLTLGLCAFAAVLSFDFFWTPTSTNFRDLGILSSINSNNHAYTPYNSYNFKDTNPFFKSLHLGFLSSIDKKTLEDTLIAHMEHPINVRAKKYISSLLHFAQERQLDPLWVISIAWTESHFNPTAQSYVKAQGLMQIMPKTGVFLHKLLKRSLNKDDIIEILRVPHVNMELGVYYLSRLYKRFGLYRYATVAYNMGPGFVRQSLRFNRPVGIKNVYYDKVKKNYKKLLAAVETLNKRSRSLGVESILHKNNHKFDLNYYLGMDIVPNLDEKIAKKELSKSRFAKNS